MRFNICGAIHVVQYMQCNLRGALTRGAIYVVQSTWCSLQGAIYAMQSKRHPAHVGAHEAPTGGRPEDAHGRLRKPPKTIRNDEKPRSTIVV